VFVPSAVTPDSRAFVLVRYAPGAPATNAGMVTGLRAQLRALDPALPILGVVPFSRMVEQDSFAWLTRMGAILFGLFGAIALLLAVVGVYGVKAYAVSLRTREIGIRMALGALPRDVIELLLKQGGLQVGFAIGAGLLLSFGAGRILASSLYQVSPTDPSALIAAASVLGISALLACWIPARRATKIDPVIALRAE
jgi:putative ABC transport system permease protein